VTRAFSDDYNSAATQRELTTSQVRYIWEKATAVDPSLYIRPEQVARLEEKRVKRDHFSRSRLFNRIMAGEPSLFSGFPVRLRHSSSEPKASVLDEIRSGFPRSKRARVRVGKSISLSPIPSVVDRWQRATSVFGVTDLHYIGARFDARLDTDALNEFNLLPRGAYGFQSQDSLVISSTGAFTDSHSDDHSGSNHCFVGSKVWLMWDTLEGLASGLEDAERCRVKGRAAFDVAAFLSLRSSRWLLIRTGQTIFVPGHLTHKVITLEAYLGLGSFYAALPSFIDSLARWTQLPPLWAKGSADRRCCTPFLTQRAIRRIRTLRNAPEQERQRWGVPYFKVRLRQLQNDPNAVIRTLTKSEPNLDALIREAQRL
jgi:hypothetical protein